MLETKDRICQALTTECVKYAGDKVKTTEHIKELVKTCSMPEGKANDLLTLRVDLIYEPVENLFAMFSVLKPQSIPKYFNEEEIARYSHYKYPSKKTIFPLKFTAVMVSPSQWITTITLKKLMELRDAGVIRYNENTQRQLTRVKRGQKEYYKITVSQKAIKEIQNLIVSGDYIPDPLTLNLPLDYDVRYDAADCMLRIPKIPYMDMLDGYHRYLALSNLYNMKKLENFTMELRIVQFPEATAQQFIWQQDQKTKLKKSDSSSLNQNDIGNQVAIRLDTDPACELRNQIKRNGGLVDFSTISQVINIYYSKQKNVVVRNVAIELRDGINSIIAENDSLLNERWNYKLTVAVIHKVVYGGNLQTLMDKLQTIPCSLSKPIPRNQIKVLRKEGGQ